MTNRPMRVRPAKGPTWRCCGAPHPDSLLRCTQRIPAGHATHTGDHVAESRNEHGTDRTELMWANRPLLRPQPKLPSPYRPDPKPHLGRTAVLLALLGAVVFAIVLLVFDAKDAVIPSDVVRPGWYVSNNPTPQGTVPPMSDAEIWGS